MNQTLIVMLIHLFICKPPKTSFGDSVLAYELHTKLLIPDIREAVFIIISKGKAFFFFFSFFWRSIDHWIV